MGADHRHVDAVGDVEKDLKRRAVQEPTVGQVDDDLSNIGAASEQIRQLL